MSEIGYVLIPVPESPSWKPSNDDISGLLQMAREAATKAGGTLTEPPRPEVVPTEYDGFLALRFEMTR